MDISQRDGAVLQRIRAMNKRVREAQQAELYFYNQPVSELKGGSRVQVNGREMGMYASYSYLGLVGHPRINAAAIAAVERFGTGTHGVRSLAGTLTLHQELEETIAAFKGAEAAITFSSGYVTNLTVISTLVGRGDYVISDKLNHASIVDGCLMSGAKFVRFRHNDMAALEQRLQSIPNTAAKLVVADSVFSMDGDIIDFPKVVELCQKYGAWLMIDEAHSLGVLGETGRGIEEHFGMEGTIDIKMGTLSKTIPSIGGYVAEPWRVKKLCANSKQFIQGLQRRGFDTMLTETAIVPVLCGSDENAFLMTGIAQKQDTFVLPVVSPAVPPGLARLRATVTAAHEPEEIEQAMDVIEQAGKQVGLIA
jgi:glycine C-acetyltransferase